jgi:hypothetical protein
MNEIGQAKVDRIKRWEYIPSDIDVSFDYKESYRNLFIHATMPADISFTFS